MSYTVLARRYRSASFDEVIGQAQIAQTLKKAIETGRIAHAYLFCGARGTGKTSTARIMAKCLNCLNSKGPTTEPCNKCDSCLAIARGEDIDVIEIDAASNTGVDNVRDIISNAQFRPARARFKVYIIDEVHMLSKNAFNALLKTLEEPPSHVKFILATTEPEKVLATILSRCQRYDFRNISTKEIAAHLKEICQQEKMNADDDALLIVAKAAAGSMRDGLSLLERLLSAGESRLTVKIVEQLMGLPRSQELFDLAQAIGQADVRLTLERTQAMLFAGMSSDSLISSLGEHLRNLLILRTCGSAGGLVEAPAVAMSELQKQADQFDPTALVQDIVILEELRRQLRQGHGGRPLLDATLVRMALADQFASIGELLTQVNPGAAAQKKKLDEGEKSAEVLEPRYIGTQEPRTERKESVASTLGSPVQASAATTANVRPPATSASDSDLPRPPLSPDLSGHSVLSTPPVLNTPSVRITPEQTAALEKDPLVRAIITELGGRIVKVE